MTEAASVPPGGAPASVAARPEGGRGARILDRGYRTYDGARTGVGGGMRSVMRATAQRTLGVHRKARFKVLPVMVIVMTYLPAAVFIGITVLTNRFAKDPESSAASREMTRTVARSLISDFPSYYGFVIAAIVLFAAFVAPDVLCSDRQSGMFGLYLASPLNRVTYLLAKGAAVLSLLLIVTLGPPVAMLVGYATQGFGPSGAAEWFSTIGRIVVAGLGVAIFHTAISMAISSFTTRRAAASATFTLLVVGSGSVVTFLVRNGALSPEWGMANLLTLPRDFTFRVFGQDPSPYSMLGGPSLMPAWAVYVGTAGWILVSLAAIVDRYRRAEVTR